jgi:hypothetical protein
VRDDTYLRTGSSTNIASARRTVPMSRPPDEYFAAAGPAPGEPPAGYFGEADTPIRGMHCDRLFVDEMSMIRGRQNGKQTTLDEMLRLGRKAGLAPLRRPWLVAPGPGSRLCHDIPSVPELEMYRNQCLAWLTLAPGGWTAYHVLEEAEQALDDARWRLACESYRWVRDYPNVSDDERLWWFAVMAIAALRYRLSSEQPETCSPGMTLAVREVAG